jgi:hypothetical protein
MNVVIDRTKKNKKWGKKKKEKKWWKKVAIFIRYGYLVSWNETFDNVFLLRHNKTVFFFFAPPYSTVKLLGKERNKKANKFRSVY